MPVALKDIYDDRFFAGFSSAIEAFVPGFSKKAFLLACKSKDWPQLELKQRMRHLSTMLNQHLPGNYRKKLSLLLKILHQVSREHSPSYGGLAFMLFPDFVEQYGIEAPELSLTAMEKLNGYTSCEFAIRPFLIRYPELVMQQMLAWSRHPSENNRRFASEGCRPRLPWAMAIPALKKDPAPILPILENLKDDPSLFVRKSVANNLNDISKDHPAIVLKLARKWQGKSIKTDWIIKHGCRTLLKKADKDALHLFGTSSGTNCSITHFSIQKDRLSIGGDLHFSFGLLLNEQVPQKLRVEYGIYYTKANGKTSRKLFKIAENLFQPGESKLYTRRLSFRDLSTRKHYPGKHSIVIIVNGKECSSKDFIVTG